VISLELLKNQEGFAGEVGSHRVSGMSLVSDSAFRRALARARDGKALDLAETVVLLQVRGDNLDTLLGHAARVRDAGLALPDAMPVGRPW